MDDPANGPELSRWMLLAGRIHERLDGVKQPAERLALVCAITHPSIIEQTFVAAASTPPSALRP